MRGSERRVRIQGWAAAAAAAMAIGGCGHGSNARGEGGAYVEQASASFQEAYRAVASGAKQTARFGEYVIDQAGQGAVRVYREAREQVEEADDRLTDAAVTVEVKARLLTEHGASAGDVDVSTDAGVVTLRGRVDDPAEAARLARTALEARGVYAVDAQLAAPPAERGAGAPSPERM